MQSAPFPACENARLQDLLECEVLDTPSNAELDDISLIASLICHVPIALVSLVDASRQWFKSKIGIDATETPREIAFCAHAILSNEPFIVEDASKDERFSDNPLVISSPYIRFYAGFPLLSSRGYALGTLCVIDKKPRSLGSLEIKLLSLLARQVTSFLEFSRTQIQLSESAKLSTLGFMAGGIAHELNTPLTVIQADAALIRKNSGEVLCESSRKSLERIESMVERISKIIRGLKTFSSSSNNETLELHSLAEVIEETTILCTSRLYNLAIMLNLIPVPKSLFTKMDRVKTSQVLLNLISNSYDAISRQKEKWIRISCTEYAAYIDLRVTDSGNGIPKEVTERMFRPFFTTKPLGKGTGLGLSLSKDYMQAQGGTLFYEEENGNTSFVMRFNK